jgi:hypothetical protein
MVCFIIMVTGRGPSRNCTRRCRFWPGTAGRICRYETFQVLAPDSLPDLIAGILYSPGRFNPALVLRLFRPGRSFSVPRGIDRRTVVLLSQLRRTSESCWQALVSLGIGLPVNPREAWEEREMTGISIRYKLRGRDKPLGGGVNLPQTREISPPPQPSLLKGRVT